MLASITQSHYWTVAGWTMLHFVWIGGLIGLFALIGKAILRSASPNSRYIFGLVCLGMLAVTPVGTFVYLAETLPAEPVMTLAGDVESSGILPAPEINSSVEATIHPYPSKGTDDRNGAEFLVAPAPSCTASSPFFNTIVDRLVARVNPVMTTVADVAPWLWMIGAPLVYLLLATGLIGAERLKKTADQISEGPIYDLSISLSQSLNVAGKVTVGISRKVASPVLVGIVRPMILLPPIALTGWSASQLEMVLLHELAHVRRWDNLVNLVQRAIEALLFFHPAAWLISRWVRLEREHCCDAIVLARGNKPQNYAEMLFSMASAPRMDQAAVAMSQNDLVPRIRRILQLEPTVMKYSRTLIVTVVAAVVAASLGASAYASQGVEAEEVEDIIIDDTDPRVIWKGDWKQREASEDKFRTHYRFADRDEDDQSATFTPEIETPGVYEVYAWWPEGWNRTSFAEYQITHSDGTSRVTRNQRHNGGQWNFLGRAWFDKGTEGHVSITNNIPGWSDQVVMADAVKFKYVSSDRRVESAFFPEKDKSPVPGEVGKSIDLTVVDSETGKLLSDVYVVATYHGYWGNWCELFTDENGFGRIPVPAEDTGYFAINIRERGYVPVEKGWDSESFSTLPNHLELSLQPSVLADGTVVDKTGKPVNGASVKVHARDMNMVFHQNHSSMMLEDGYFTYDHVLPGNEKVSHSIQFSKATLSFPVIDPLGRVHQVVPEGTGCPVMEELSIPAGNQTEMEFVNSKITFHKYNPEVPGNSSDAIYLTTEGSFIMKIPEKEQGCSDDSFNVGGNQGGDCPSQPDARTGMGVRNMPFPCTDEELIRRLSGCKGKVVLLNHSSGENKVSEVEYELLKRIRDENAGNPNFAMIGTHPDESRKNLPIEKDQSELLEALMAIEQSASAGKPTSPGSGSK